MPEEFSGDLHKGPALLNVKEVAAILKCSTSTIRKAIRGKLKGTPQIPAIRIGRCYLVRRDKLIEWLALSESDGTAGDHGKANSPARTDKTLAQ